MRATSDSRDKNKTDKPLRYSVKGKRMRFFESQGVDELVSICMGLAQELWVYKEKQAIIEDLLNQKKMISDNDLEKHSFSDEKRLSLDNERQEFIDRIFFTLREEAESLQHSSNSEPDPPTMT
ncbi:MAG: hypothetical protein CBC47_08890 [Alphaproteobacteria bacterium TMED87]|nr:hypothetical protein [Rhodospirillaceae bacterium]OUV07599.1 MAG: hypothetical protein CBC47_08890 [Alphaproteobacteria bacterium TMED87]|tara:strand:- start:584 stop:952 length:369 start_codon:yes stop_codon:yes gene_type:complete